MRGYWGWATSRAEPPILVAQQARCRGKSAVLDSGQQLKRDGTKRGIVEVIHHD